MLTAMLALVHVTEAVNLLGSGDMVMAGATTAKAIEWLLHGRFLRGKSVMRPSIEWQQRRNLALSGADAAHSENRRLRQLALEIYTRGTWKSKMQAARKISEEVHRTEMVVLRWIREHHKKEHE
jgi:hypothetical protein